MQQLKLEGFHKLQFSSPQEWVDWLNSTLRIDSESISGPVVLDLFAGCGGLALGFEASGFKTLGYECKPEAVATYNLNLHGHCEEVMLDVGMPKVNADVIIGGPPCQPFSQIGYQRGNRDSRDGFPIFLDAVRRIEPKIAIIENVRGLLYRNKDYFRLVAKELEKFGYAVDARVLKSWEYGVPQKRERVVIVASKTLWEWPKRVVDKAVSAGQALGELAFEVTPDSKFLTKSMDKYIAEYEKKSKCVNPRDLHLDKPSRTVTCRNLGGATADMLRIKLQDGRRRMLHVREAARLQSFPDSFDFVGTEYQRLEQIGNAVPPLMAYAVASMVLKSLDAEKVPQNNAFKRRLLDESTEEIKIDQALNILKFSGVQVRSYTSTKRILAALILLGLLEITPQEKWENIANKKKREVDLESALKHSRKHYPSLYKESKSQRVLKNISSDFESVRIIETCFSSKDRVILISDDFKKLTSSYLTPHWEEALFEFKKKNGFSDDRLSKVASQSILVSS